jgi:hypothetical protein
MPQNQCYLQDVAASDLRHHGLALVEWYSCQRGTSRAERLDGKDLVCGDQARGIAVELYHQAVKW